MPSHNRYDVLNQILEVLHRDGRVSVETLGIGHSTAFRYIKELNERFNLKICMNNGNLTAVNEVRIEKIQPLRTEPIGKGLFTKYLLLKMIDDFGPIGRSDLNIRVQQKHGEMSLREMDVHIRELIHKETIVKNAVGKEIFYCIESLMKPQLSANEKEHLQDYLKNHKGKFPYTGTINRAALRFGLNPSLIMAEDSTTGDDTTSTQVWDKLEDCCRMRQAARVYFDTGKHLCILPLYWMYHSRNQSWYLKYLLNKKNAKKIHALRLLHIREVAHEVITRPDLKTLDCLIGEEKAMEIQAFSASIESGIEWIIAFEDELSIVKRAKSRLGSNVGWTDHGGYQSYKGIVYGKEDLMAWLRGFGSSALIVEPKQFRAEMLDSTMRVLEKYEVGGLK